MKRFIVFAYHTSERADGWRSIFGLSYELHDAEIMVSAAKDLPNVDQIEIYDIHKEELVTDWMKGLDRVWRQYVIDPE